MAKDEFPSQTFEHACRDISRDVEAKTRRLNGLAIEEIKRCKEEGEVVDLARAYYHLMRAKERITDAMKDHLNKTFEVLRTRDYPEMLEARGIKNVPLADVGHIIGSSTRTTVKMNNKPACMSWLRSYTETAEDGTEYQPFAHLITETVNANTLGATAKELIKEGKDFPTEITLDDETVHLFGTGFLDNTLDGETVQLFETGFLDNTTCRKIPE